MAKRRAEGKAARVTVTVTRDQNRQLQALAARHKVSVGWIVRHAIERFLERGASIELPSEHEEK
jgi:predicted transcriptional regulator